jgi:hypothetical protein
VRTAEWQIRRDDLRGSGRLQLAFRHLVALDRGRRRDVEEVVVQRDARGALVAEPLRHIHLAVAVGVAQRDDAGSLAASCHQAHVEVAVGGDGHVPRRPEIVGHDEGAKTLRQFQAAVVGVAGRWRRRSARRHDTAAVAHAAAKQKEKARFPAEIIGRV